MVRTARGAEPEDPLLSVSACPHPFDGRRVDYAVPAGLTIAEIVDLIQPDPLLRAHGVAFIGEHLVPRDRWRVVRPKPGALLSIRLLPSGGGGLRIGLMIGIAVLAIGLAIGAPYLTPLIAEGLAVGETAAAAIYAGASAALVTGLTLAVNFAVPPPVPELSKSYGNDKPSYAITGARNRADPWGKLAFLLGRFKLTPAYAAVPYREVVGSANNWPDALMRIASRATAGTGTGLPTVMVRSAYQVKLPKLRSSS